MKFWLLPPSEPDPAATPSRARQSTARARAEAALNGPSTLVTIRSKSGAQPDRKPAAGREHPRRALGGSGPERDLTLYNNIGSLEPVVLQNASRFTGPKHATVATQIRDTPASSAMCGARCRSGAQRCCLLRAGALQPESLGFVLRVSCELRAHNTRGV